jgi:hypothetical protein
MVLPKIVMRYNYVYSYVTIYVEPLKLMRNEQMRKLYNANIRVNDVICDKSVST